LDNKFVKTLPNLTHLLILESSKWSYIIWWVYLNFTTKCFKNSVLATWCINYIVHVMLSLVYCTRFSN